MTFTPTIFIIVYFAGVGVFLVLSVLNIYHVIRFSFLDKTPLIATFAYLLLAAAVILITLRAVNSVAWSEPLTLDLPFNGAMDEGLE